MAENKKSFILYADLKHTLAKVPDDVAGRLFKVILEYVNDNNPIIENDLLLEVLFEPIKQTLKRDLQRWEQFRIKQSENGKKGGRPKNDDNDISVVTITEVIDNQTNNTEIEESEIKPNNPSLLDESQKSLSVSVNVSDSVNVTANDIVIVNETNNDIIGAKAQKINFRKCLLDICSNVQLVDDWLAVRKTKKATNTKTAFDLFVKELQISDITIDEILTTCVEKSWSGYKFEWILNERKKVAPKKESEAPKSKFEQNQEMYERLQKKLYGNEQNTNDTTAIGN